MSSHCATYSPSIADDHATLHCRHAQRITGELRCGGDAKRRRLRSVDIREAVLSREGSYLEQLTRSFDHACVRRQRHDRAAKIRRRLLWSTGAVDGIDAAAAA